ncbi:MAG TPA: hypothetical protein VN736_00470 [Candidatus Limnocylindrales bacterium]|nr:hypothetical protein [Candidatus Limnocylindrales bacterium]
MAKRGRPSKYREDFPSQATRFCRLGATNENLAELFEVTISTIGKWLSEIPEFSDAVKAGREIADAKVADALYHRAIGYTHESEEIFQYRGEVIRAKTKKHYPPDTAAAFIWLKNRRPDLWRDKSIADSTDDRLDEIFKIAKTGPPKRNPEPGA